LLTSNTRVLCEKLNSLSDPSEEKNWRTFSWSKEVSRARRIIYSFEPYQENKKARRFEEEEGPYG